MIFFVFCLSLVLGFFLFVLVAKVRPFVAIIVALLRSLTSFLYFPYLFPTSDQSEVYWPSIINTTCSNLPLSFSSLAAWLHCHLGINNLQIVNLIYCCFGSLILSLCFSSLKTTKVPLRLSLRSSNKLWSYDFIFLLCTCDPSVLFYSSAFGKDIITYFFVFSFFALIFAVRKVFSFIFLTFLLTSLALLSDRPYVFVFLGCALLISQFFTVFSVKPSFPFFEFKFIVTPRISSTKLITGMIFIATSLFVVFSVVNYYLEARSVTSLLDQYTSEMGGSLSVPSFIPGFLRPMVFMLLPLPFLPLHAASLPLGISTIILFAIIFKIHTYRVVSDGFSSLSAAIVLSLLIFFAFGFTLTNLGIGVRYRAQYILPSLTSVLLLISRAPFHKSLLFPKSAPPLSD